MFIHTHGSGRNFIQFYLQNGIKVCCISGLPNFITSFRLTVPSFFDFQGVLPPPRVDTFWLQVDRSSHGAGPLICGFGSWHGPIPAVAAWRCPCGALGLGGSLESGGPFQGDCSAGLSSSTVVPGNSSGGPQRSQLERRLPNPYLS